MFKNPLSALILILLLVALPPSVSVAQQGVPPQSNGQPERPASRRAPREQRTPEPYANIERDFVEALTVIEDNHVDGGRLDYNDIFKSSITGMLRSLDPHSNYFDSQEYEKMLGDQRSEYFGIGASIINRRSGDEIDTYIIETLGPNAPAGRAGLRFGDRIVEVDGQPARGKSFREVRDLLRGPRGTVVRVKVERAANGQIETFEITRDAVAQPSISEVYMIKPGVGYVAMTSGFNLATADELEAALDHLRARGMKSLILDLRNNLGGILDQAIRVADMFLERGQVILTQKGRIRGSQRTYTARNAAPDMTPLVVLINENSASAAEIVAGAMQDQDRALIVGETSFGKGLVQGVWSLDYGAGLALTYAKYYTPAGRLIQRDYTHGGLYDYYTHGGLSTREEKAKQGSLAQKPTGPESHTATGRPVYGGGGITPDETVEPRLYSASQLRLLDPVFAFVRELVNGRVAGFDEYRVPSQISDDHDLRPKDFPVTEALYRAFKEFVVRRPSYKIAAAQLERDRDFVQRQLRYDIISAAYGTVTAAQVFNDTDPQIARAIEALPRAKELALAAMRKRSTPQKPSE